MGDLLYPALSRVLSSSWPQLYPSVQYSRPFWHWYPMRPPTHWGSLGMGDVAKGFPASMRNPWGNALTLEPSGFYTVPISYLAIFPVREKQTLLR